MELLDLNVLVYAFRQDLPEHPPMRDWLMGRLNGEGRFALNDAVLSGFLRIVTNPRIFAQPSPTAAGLAFCEQLRSSPNCLMLSPGGRHWEIFRRLCEPPEIRGNLIPDAFLAALAIESGSVWVTADRGFARFPGLRWRHPLR